MSVILEHLQAHMVVYLIAVICILPAIVLSRRFSVPVLQFCMEVCIYWAILHTILHFFVKLAAWFRTESSFDRTKIEWVTPLYKFWIPEAYAPQWLKYVEVGIFVAVLILTWYFRPIQIKRDRRRYVAPPKKKPTGYTSQPAYGANKKKGVRR